MTPSTRLIFMTFPQAWDASGLKLRVLVLPRGNPLQPLVGSSLSFAAADFRVAVRFVPEPGKLPNRADALTPVTLSAIPPAGRTPLFTKLASLFNIVVPEGAVDPVPAQPPFRKFLPGSFLKASGRTRPSTPFGAIDDEYGCALKASSMPSTQPLPEPSVDLGWGDVLQFALRQPLLAERLGMLFRVDVPVPAGHAMRDGGWIYTELDAAGDFAAEAAGNAELTASYAARVPAFETARPFFVPNLVAVATGPGTPPIDDDVLTENEEYADGFAAFVHGEQPLTANVSDDEGDPLPSVKDVGIRLGWDDEQVLVWLNRQVMSDPNAPGHTPGAVGGYRVDVRRAHSNDPFTSLTAVKGTLDLDGMPLGQFDGELTIETVPVRFPNSDRDWLPPYFTAWAGGSLVTTNAAALAFDGRPPAERAPTQYEPIGASLVRLRYGRDYEFRVRLADLSGGGPPLAAPMLPGRPKTAIVAFRRGIRPKAPTLAVPVGTAVDRAWTSFPIARPRLGFPEAVFTGAAGAYTALVADVAASKAEEREPGIPDPDVSHVEIQVQVRVPAGDAADDGHVVLYTTTRAFPAGPGAALTLELAYVDRSDLSGFASMPVTGPLQVPSARDLRLVVTAMGRPRADYYCSEDHRRGLAPLVLEARREATTEIDLFDVSEAPSRYIRALFFQPDAIEDLPLRAAGSRHDAPSAICSRLAQEIGLQCRGTTIFGRPGQRLSTGASAAVRCTIAPDKSAIQFVSHDDLARRWIVAVQATVLRDWTWDGVEPVAFIVRRQLDGVQEDVGIVEMVRAVGPVALDGPDRSRSHICFFDAIDPKTEDGRFPAEIDVSYRLVPQLRGGGAATTPTLALHLPVSTAPLQTPKLKSAGLAFAPYERADDYSATFPRARALWFEFEERPRDPQDQFFCRVLAHAPDPVLGMPQPPPPMKREDPLPIDPEPVRVILPSQPRDDSGLDAMQPLKPAQPGAARFFVPLPPGLTVDSPELFGLFTYEFRVGHDDRRWSTARGRFGPALRVTGVQHPAPALPCYVRRTERAIRTSAPFAEAYAEGRDFNPSPQTEMWFLLYAQVREVSGASWRNVLLLRHRGRMLEEGVEPLTRYAATEFDLAAASGALRSLALSADAPLSMLAVELMPAPLINDGGNLNRYGDPLGADLGQVRILRTSPLTPVPTAC
jgi:hypothetical protein